MVQGFIYRQFISGATNSKLVGIKRKRRALNFVRRVLKKSLRAVNFGWLTVD
jgi:hypothetical protein